MPNHPEGLEEAVDAGVASAERHLGDYADASPAERAALRRSVREVILAAAPAIRNQERQRIREALIHEGHNALIPGAFDAFKGVVDVVLPEDVTDAKG